MVTKCQVARPRYSQIIALHNADGNDNNDAKWCEVTCTICKTLLVCLCTVVVGRVVCENTRVQHYIPYGVCLSAPQGHVGNTQPPSRAAKQRYPVEVRMSTNLPTKNARILHEFSRKIYTSFLGNRLVCWGRFLKLLVFCCVSVYRKLAGKLFT